MIKYLLAFTFSFSLISAVAQRKVDVLHYRFELVVNDKDDNVKGKAEIRMAFLENTSKVEIDLNFQDATGKGMVVDVTKPSSFRSDKERNKVIIDLGKAFSKGDTTTVSISYHGVPQDGLIISKSKFGKRTFFADNWPNRAHHWIPCVDDPADKASVEFVVTAPAHYQVVSNGVLKECTNISPDVILTHWKEEQPLPTKIMVVGIAEFAVEYATSKTGIPVSSWVYPENKTTGFYDYAPAIEILEFFTDYIGPFPYRKLANVQSKTIFGGMENAGAIFYAENTVNGNRSEERLIAHEIVHQWFGDHVTEVAFSHLWLSEGFATYLAEVFMEHKFGRKKLEEKMMENRKQVLAFARNNNTPVVDTVSPLMELLNANSYQKGGWILHMLREQVCDYKFRAIIKEYYSVYAGKNASTRDFQAIAERIAGYSMNDFFNQWLYNPEIPSLQIRWKYDETAKKLVLNVNQKQKTPFKLPLQILVEDVKGESVIYNLEIDGETQNFEYSLANAVKQVKADPNVRLLAIFQVSTQ